MEKTNCNLCGSSQYTDFVNLTDLLLEREHVKTMLVRCANCGLIYQNPRLTIDEMSASYPSDYESYVSGENLKKNSWLMNQAIEYGLNKRAQFVTRFKLNGNLLDIGCATGLFLRNMQKYPDWELFGVEINSHAANVARDQFGLNVFIGTLEEASYPDNFFDAVTMWDVMEHLHDPTSSLSEIRRILKPDGILVFRVPNGSSWPANLFGKYWSGYDSPRHLFVFEQSTINNILKKVGFQTLHMSTRGGSYPTFVLSIKFWLTWNGIKDTSRNNIVRILGHPILRIATSPIFIIGDLGLHGPLITVTALNKSKNH